MKALIAAGVLACALCVYGFVSMASGMASTNNRVNAQVNAYMGGARR